MRHGPGPAVPLRRGQLPLLSCVLTSGGERASHLSSRRTTCTRSPEVRASDSRGHLVVRS